MGNFLTNASAIEGRRGFGDHGVDGRHQFVHIDQVLLLLRACLAALNARRAPLL